MADASDLVNGIFYDLDGDAGLADLPLALAAASELATSMNGFRQARHRSAARRQVPRRRSPRCANHSLAHGRSRVRVGPRGQPERRDYRQPRRRPKRAIEDQGAQAPRAGLAPTPGARLVLEAHPRASDQDRDGGGPLLAHSRGSFPFIEKVFADIRRREGRHGHRDRRPSRSCAKSPDRKSQDGFGRPTVAAGSWIASTGRINRWLGDWPTCASARAPHAPDWPEPHDFRNRL